MERSTHSFTYKGSISDAVNESRSQKKLFVVYISGEDENSVKMDQFTWPDQRVFESISKCCIFLQLTEGSVDASQFCAIYPQGSIPSISVIGLNGVMLWHYEGYITADNLISNIDKASAALHMQEAALTLLTAALASKEPEPLNPIPSVACEQAISSKHNVPSTSADKSTEDSKPEALTNIQQTLTENPNESKSPNNNTLAEVTCSQVDSHDVAKITSMECSSSNSSIDDDAHFSKNVNCEPCNLLPNSDLPDGNSTGSKGQTTTSSVADGIRTRGPLPSQVTTEPENASIQTMKIDGSSHFVSAVKSNDVHLSIRMPNGISLQTKLTVEDTLSSVKIFVDERIDTSIGSYDLAVPYPRQLFNGEDMVRTLSELGFASRQALIVVPHRQVTRPRGGQSASDDSQISTTRAASSENGGYFGYLKGFLSYFNPFSYLRGGSSSSYSETARNDGLWQYGPNPAQNRLSSTGTPQRLSSSTNQNTAASSSGGSITSSRPSRRFGSNIHTLRHDDDSSDDRNRNVFWNGNSTQFGGDDKK